MKMLCIHHITQYQYVHASGCGRCPIAWWQTPKEKPSHPWLFQGPDECQHLSRHQRYVVPPVWSKLAIRGDLEAVDTLHIY